MKKRRQLHVSLSRRRKLVLDVQDNESLTLSLHTAPHLPNHPTSKKGQKRRPPYFTIDGYRWLGKDFYILKWGSTVMRTGDKMSAELVAGQSRATKPRVRKHKHPLKTCSFCNRKVTEVKHLVEAEYLFARICDDCVRACGQAMGINAT
jgi:hypothetical protein